MNKITIKQWHMFQAVVKYGGFSQASEKLFKSTSSIHNSIGKLEETLSVRLLRVEGRKTLLTSHGKEIQYLVEKLLSDATNLEAYFSEQSSLRETSVKIAVDELFPIGIIRSVLQSISIELSLKCLEITHVSTALFDSCGHSDIVLTKFKSVIPGCMVKRVFSLSYVAVCGSGTSVLDSDNAISADDLIKHIEIKVDREPVGKIVDAAKNNSCWVVDKLSSAIELVCDGIGYAWLPYIDVQQFISEGKLRQIAFKDQPNIREVDFYLNVRNDLYMKPGVERIVHHFKHFDSDHKEMAMVL